MAQKDYDTEKVTIRLPKRYIAMLDFLVEIDDYSTRSEAIRSSVRDMIYERVDLAMDKMKKMQDAEQTLREMDQFKKEYLQQ